jgi:opacity protein-like surface antigen
VFVGDQAKSKWRQLMKKLVLIAVFLLGFSMMVMAQDTPAIEVFGGYSYVRADPTTMDGAPAGQYSLNMNGWNGSVVFNGTPWLGFLADFGGYYGTLRTDYNYGPDGYSWADIDIYSVMFGPKFAVARTGKYTPFIQALFGYARVKAKELGETYSENDFAMAFGAGLDINMSDRIAIRPAQVEYFTIKMGQTGDFADNFRYSAGVVFKLGKR